MTGVGVVGCGNISPIYLRNLGSFAETEVIAVADLDPAKAALRSQEFGVPAARDVSELLEDSRVNVVLNLTVPRAHGQVAREALLAGKAVYNEKPLAIGWPEAQELVALADSKDLRLGCAPDTVLGAGVQTCRDLIDDGAIGQPVAAQGFMMCPGHESWHPDPAFYYQKGGGPMFDMGPYYLTALVTLLGPVRRVQGSARTSFSKRTIGSQPFEGREIAVEVPTHLSTVLDFHSGPIGQFTCSFDVVCHTFPCLEVYGSEGSIRVPDPNGFGGPVFLRRKGDAEWQEVPVVRPYSENSRGLGVLEMAIAQREQRPHRASGNLALHVCEIMHAAHWASERGEAVLLSTCPPRPEPMPKAGL